MSETHRTADKHRQIHSYIGIVLHENISNVIYLEYIYVDKPETDV